MSHQLFKDLLELCHFYIQRMDEREDGLQKSNAELDGVDLVAVHKELDRQGVRRL